MPGVDNRKQQTIGVAGVRELLAPGHNDVAADVWERMLAHPAIRDDVAAGRLVVDGQPPASVPAAPTPAKAAGKGKK